MKTTSRVMMICMLVALGASSTPTARGAQQRASSFAVPDAALDMIRRLPIQHNGRPQPFDSFARETLNAITGHPSIDGRDPVVTVLSMMARPEDWQPRAIIAVPFVPLREAMGMDRSAHAIS